MVLRARRCSSRPAAIKLTTTCCGCAGVRKNWSDEACGRPILSQVVLPAADDVCATEASPGNRSSPLARVQRHQRHSSVTVVMVVPRLPLKISPAAARELVLSARRTQDLQLNWRPSTYELIHEGGALLKVDVQSIYLGARARAGVLFLRDTGSYGPHILHVLVHVVHVHVT